MKKPGIIAGIGPASSIEYYKLIIETYQHSLQTKHYPEMLLHSIDMTQMLDLVAKGREDLLISFLQERIEVLEKGGADFVLLASNTPHLVFEALADAVSVPMLSIVDATCQYIADLGIKQAGLFGTQFTMSKGFYQRIGKEHGIDILSPDDASQDFIHQKYMAELVFNEIIPETKQALIKIAMQLKVDTGIEGLILGGTELPLILQQDDFDGLRIFDTTQIHVNSIVNMMQAS